MKVSARRLLHTFRLVQINKAPFSGKKYWINAKLYYRIRLPSNSITAKPCVGYLYYSCVSLYHLLQHLDNLDGVYFSFTDEQKKQLLDYEKKLPKKHC